MTTKQQKSEEVTSIEALSSMNRSINVSQLARDIESKSGKEKWEFTRKLSKEQRDAYLNYLKDRDTQMVTGVFKCLEPVGGSVTFSAKAWDGCEINTTMEHGQEYTIPYAIAVQLEKGCWWPTHSYLLDAQGKPVITTGKKNYRFSFNTSDIR